MEWRKVDKFGERPEYNPFLLMDEYGEIHVGYTAFDFYDAEYWCPIPKMPMETVITNDDCVASLLKNSQK